MPRMLHKIRECTQQEMFEAALAELQQFRDLRDWQRSKKGNLCRKWDGRTVTIFRHGRRFKFSVADKNKNVEFSPDTYGSEEEAMDVVKDVLGVGVY